MTSNEGGLDGGVEEPKANDEQQQQSNSSGESPVSPQQLASSESISEDECLEALERWFIKEAVRLQVRSALLEPNQENIVHRALDKLTDFPPFRGDARMRTSFDQLFALFPKLDSALKARGGTTNLERFFVSFIASPIISSARLARLDAAAEGKANSPAAAAAEGRSNDPDDSQNGGFGNAAAQLMQEILGNPTGVCDLLEELKTVHHVSEMRSSLQGFFASLAENWTSKFLHLVRRKPREAKSTFDRLPKHTILSALKFHAPNSATAAAVQVLFSKPFGMLSFWQRFLSEATNLTSVSSEFADLEEIVSLPCKAALAQAEKDLIAAFLEDGSTLNTGDPVIIRARREIVVEFLKSRFKIELDSESKKWAALRYVEVRHQKAGLELLVEIVGKEEFTKPLRTILSSSKSRLSDSLLAKNTGFIKFAEALFDCFESGLKDAEENPTNDSLLRERFKERWLIVQMRAVAVLHNVLLNDSGLLIHETIQWLVDAYESAKELELPSLRSLMQGLSPEEAQGLKEEAFRTRKRELDNLNRPFGKLKSPPPKLPLAGRLLGRYSDVLKGEVDAFQPRTCDSTRLLYVATGTAPNSADFIVDLSVSWEDKQEPDLKRRGYVQCGGTSYGKVWLRRKAHRPSALQCDARPIETVAIVPSLVLRDKDWVVIPRNLNKGAMGVASAYLAYRRGSGKKHLYGLRLVDSLAESNKRFGADDWTLVSTFSTSMLYESKLWCLTHPPRIG